MLCDMARNIEPFTIETSGAEIEDLNERLRRARWPEKETVRDWSQGVPLTYIRDLCRFWLEEYDWDARRAYLNSFPQYLTSIDELDIHFLHVPSPHFEALPLILTHGWPGSVVEFLDVIELLTNPTARGGDVSDAFHVVVPSLPGYGFSGKPTEPGWSVLRTAKAWATLMERLGYDRFGAQGGDWGSIVTTSMAMQNPDRIVGIHLNMVRGSPSPEDGTLTEEENAALLRRRYYTEWDSGYNKLQATRPQTIAYSLVDSPVGQCAWILEKFWSWSDTAEDPVGALGADRILDNVMLYWLNSTGGSSARMYWESVGKFQPTLVTVPMGASIFPKEIFCPSRRWAERSYADIRYWGEPPVGGHFAAFEQPEIFVGEVRNFFRLVR